MTIITCFLVAVFWPQILLFIGMIAGGMAIVMEKLWELTCVLVSVFIQLSIGLLALVLISRAAHYLNLI